MTTEKVEQTLDRGDDVTDDNKTADAAETTDAKPVMSDDDFDSALEALKTGGEDKKDEPEKAEAEEAKPEEVEAKKEDETEGKKPEDHLIPKARFDEAQRRKDAEIAELTKRLSAVEKQTAKAAPTEVDPVEALRDSIATNEAAYEDALLDNSKEKASAIRQTLSNQRDELMQMVVANASESARVGSSDDARYDALLGSLESDYPVIVTGSDDFDQAVVNEMIRMRDVYITTGSSQSEALKIAAKYVLGPKAEPKAEPEPEVVDKKKAVEDERTLAARKLAADAVKDTPASLEGGGGPPPSGKIVMGNLSQKQFAKLPEDVLAKYRGDVAA